MKFQLKILKYSKVIHESKSYFFFALKTFASVLRRLCQQNHQNLESWELIDHDWHINKTIFFGFFMHTVIFVYMWKNVIQKNPKKHLNFDYMEAKYFFAKNKPRSCCLLNFMQIRWDLEFLEKNFFNGHFGLVNKNQKFWAK